MTVTRVTAHKDTISFTVEGASLGALVRVRELSPATGNHRLLLSQYAVKVAPGEYSVPRFDGVRDRLTSRFILDGIPGVCYVTDFAPGASRDESEYPSSPSIMAFGANTKDEIPFHTSQGGVGFCISAMMASSPDICPVIEHVYNGRTYYFRRDAVESYDQQMLNGYRKGFRMTCAIINSDFGYGYTGDEEMMKSLRHPHQDRSFKEAYMSAFNVVTDDGVSAFCACIDFIGQRYTRPDRKYGLAVGMILNNEVTSQYYWANAGEMTCHDFTREYTTVMRLTWQIMSQYYKAFRVYVSMDHFWTGTFDSRFPLRFYSGRNTLEEINGWAKREGDFDWNVVHHPYPENLRYPDFWNDRSVDFNFSTYRITFKNIEMLPAYLSQPHLLYRGRPRRIVLNEQGFNSRGDELKDLSEQQAAAAYVLAYMKIRKLPTIDYFTVHAYVDNPYEFGLNLGVYRFDPDSPDHTGEKKPIYYAICDMDTDRESARVAWARDFIGHTIFDYLLDPPIRYADRDTSHDGLSKEGARGPVKKNKENEKA